MSQREAARLWGVSRAAIQRAIKSGKLSANAGGRIDASEMTRAFGPAQSRLDEPKEPPQLDLLKAENQALRAELEAVRGTVAAQNEHINDLRQFARQLGHDRRPWWRFWR